MMKFSYFPSTASLSEAESARSALEKLYTNPEAGFIHAAQSDSTWSVVQNRAEQLRGVFDQIVVVGIGGSSLGARALHGFCGNGELFFLDNLDPNSTHEVLRQIRTPDRVHWLWISKSGTTLETLIHLEFVSQFYREKGLKISSFSTVISEIKEGPLQDWAQKNQVVMLPIGSQVSGRFSVFTAAGLLPAVLSGVDLKALRKGVEKVDFFSPELLKLMVSTRKSWEQGQWVTLLWTYGDQLRPLTAWLQQLWAESLAKKVTENGQEAPRVSFPVPCVGSLDQHSILQQVVEGARDKWVWLLRLDSLEKLGPKINTAEITSNLGLIGKTYGQVFAAQAEGLARALNEVKVPTVECFLPDLSEENVGYCLFFFELLVAGLGSWNGVHPFNQPGVERGKTITQEILRKSLS